MKAIRLTLFIVIAGGLLSLPVQAGWVQDNPEEAPRPVWTVTPTMPYSHALHGVNGEAKVEFFLSDTGRPIDIQVLESSHPDYIDAVKRALRQWRFERSGPDSLWTGVRYRLTFVFTRGNV